MIELLATIAILAVVAAIAIPFVANYVATSRKIANQQILEVLNDALNRYKMQGGDIKALTERAVVDHVIDKLKTPIAWAGTTHQFLSQGFTIDTSSLYVSGSGKHYRFTAFRDTEISSGGSIAVYDPSAEDYFTRVVAAGGSFDQTAINPTYTDGYVKWAISDFIAGCKADGVWDKLSEAYLLCGVNFNGLVAKLKYEGTPTLTNTGFTPGNYTGAGTGAGLNKSVSANFLDTGVTASSLGISVSNSSSASVYLTSVSTEGAWLMPAVYTAQMGVLMRSYRSGSNGITIFSSGVGFRVGFRINNDGFGYTNGNPSGSYNDVSTGVSNGNFAILSYINNQTADTPRGTISFAHVGKGLSATEAVNLSARVNTLMTTLGCNVY